MTRLSRKDFLPASDWIEALPPEVRDRVEERAQKHVAAHRLAEVRHALSVTQSTLASRTGLKQAEVSRIENNPASVQVRTLDRYVSGLGGRLRMVAEFPGGVAADIPLRFDDEDSAATRPAPSRR